MSSLRPRFVQLRRGTTEEWSAKNTILRNGEPGIDGTLRLFRIGDGYTPWESLKDFFPVSAASSAAMSALQGARPSLWSATYSVDPSLPEDAASGRYTTINAALAAANANTAAKAQGPYRWQRIVVEPGEYYERVKGVQYVALVGRGEDPTSVRVWADGNNTPGEAYNSVLSADGTSFYVANMWFDYTGNSEFWHAMRDGGYGGNVPRLVFCENVLFTVPDTAPLDGQVLDIAPGRNTQMLYSKCIFRGRSLPQTVSAILGNTSQDWISTRPSKIIFVECTSDGNHLTYVQNIVADLDFRGLANMVGLLEAGSSTNIGDEYAWIGGTFLTGRATWQAGVSRDAAGDVWAATTRNPSGCTWRIDPKVLNVNVEVPEGRIQRIVDVLPSCPINGVTPEADDYVRTPTLPNPGATWGTVAADSFTAVDGSLVGHTATTGQTWVAAPGDASPLITANKAGSPSGAARANLPISAASTLGIRLTIDYDLAQNSYIDALINYFSTSMNSDVAFVGVEMHKAGQQGVLEDKSSEATGIGTGVSVPLGGSLVIEVVGTVVTVSAGGTQVASGTLPGQTRGAVAQLFFYGQSGNGQDVDNLLVEHLVAP